MSILPVGNDTIIYGSCDAGRTVHATDPELNALMREAGEKQNLKAHECRVVTKQVYRSKVKCHSPTTGPSLLTNACDFHSPEFTLKKVDVLQKMTHPPIPFCELFSYLCFRRNIKQEEKRYLQHLMRILKSSILSPYILVKQQKFYCSFIFNFFCLESITTLRKEVSVYDMGNLNSESSSEGYLP